ncbi:type VII secretion protein EccE [Allocatelliglobosispora scoriae]|uniref:Type VII secretion protein EccE n=1 Tax=Allocatelliglobosispora scoriae TaxID=643052 RepID=A0A841BV09_9ACTN|nr:type VII secretion protein EccE [Allocatelliglobosispora scoriae]MBB5871296.1 type VII secretion protein EccE [Allocatelliglobosispora scoriae]
MRKGARRMTVVAERSRATPAAVPRRGSRTTGVHSGQIVATQIAVVAMIVGVAAGVVATLALAPIAAALLVLAWSRLRGRWLFQWTRVWLSYRTRCRTLAPASDATALITLLRPGARIEEAELDGVPGAIIADGGGLTALVDLGDPALLPAQAMVLLRSPVDLLPTPAPDTPRHRFQLVLSAVHASGSGSVGSAYRQLTEGRIAAGERAVLAVHVPAAEEWSESDLRRALSGAVRKVHRKLGDSPARVLGPDGVLAALTELAHHDGAHPVRETWSSLHAGGLPQAAFRLRRWPDLRGEAARDLIPRLLALPGSTVTVSLTVGPWVTAATTLRADLVVRLTAADAPSLAAATTALHRVLASEKAAARRLDGEHLDGLAATLPLGGTAPAVLPTQVEHGSIRPAAPLSGLRLPFGTAGLMVGPNRRREPVTVRFFRPEPTRAMLIGGVTSAQLLALRSMALGARVIVQTTRPQAWERFFRNLGGPNDSIALAIPGKQVSVPAATRLRPLLLVVDVGAVGADRSAGHPWHTTLVLRDELAAVDIDALGHADIALVQPMSAQAAGIAVAVLGLSESQRDAFARPVPGLIGVVHRRSVRWASLGTAPLEQQLLT